MYNEQTKKATDGKKNCKDLVREAQLGNTDSMDSLVVLAEKRLRIDLYRLTLDHNLTEDLVQESLLEMVKVLGKLKDADKFWPWLYKVALNKLRFHYRSEQRQRKIASDESWRLHREDQQTGLADVVADDLRQIVMGAMKKLAPRQRAILTMRCYRNMDYDQIAESLNCSEFAARMLFHRAKNSLKKQLGKSGFTKGTLLGALVIFGKMTAESETAAAALEVSTINTSVGLTASLAAIVTSKTTLLTLTASGIIAAGTISVIECKKNCAPSQTANTAVIAETNRNVATANAGIQDGELWYYLPQGNNGGVMMQLTENGKRVWRQDGEVNYYRDENIVRIENYRPYNRDLTVRLLPTDSEKLESFICQMTGQSGNIPNINSDKDKIVAIANHGDSKVQWSVMRNTNVIEEDFFKNDWPAGTEIIDNRDEMHKRGWTYFHIDGVIGNKNVKGNGRIAFSQSASQNHPAWINLRVGTHTYTDNGQHAQITSSLRKIEQLYAGESFFKGLSRPWLGLHTIDSIRRDAAESQIEFVTRTLDNDKVEIELLSEHGRLLYEVNLKDDLIERIKIFQGETEAPEGELRFSYMQSIENAGYEFKRPTLISTESKMKNKPTKLWLFELDDHGGDRK